MVDVEKYVFSVAYDVVEGRSDSIHTQCISNSIDCWRSGYFNSTFELIPMSKYKIVQLSIRIDEHSLPLKFWLIVHIISCVVFSEKCTESMMFDDSYFSFQVIVNFWIVNIFVRVPWQQKMTAGLSDTAHGTPVHGEMGIALKPFLPN